MNTVLIELKNGNIEVVGATNADIIVKIIDHDSNDQETALHEIHIDDAVMTEQEINAWIQKSLK